MAKAKKGKLTIEDALVPVEEQPYEVPENWCWTRVGTICSFVGGGTPSKTVEAYWNGDIPWASVKDVKGDYLLSTIDTITSEGVENSATNVCGIDELIMVTRIEPAKTIISKIEVAINQDLKIVKSNLSSSFLHYYFKCFKHLFEEKSSGSTVLGITIPNVQNTVFPLPPLAEQKRIVEQIENLFSKLDEAKEKATVVVDSYEIRKKAILHNAFEGIYTSEWRKINNYSIDDWEDAKINEVCVPRAGFAFDSKKFTDSGFQIIRMGNLYAGKLDLSRSPVFYNMVDVDTNILSRSLVHDGDILLTLTGTKYKRDYGYAVCIEGNPELLVNQRILCLSPTEKIDRDYLLYYLRSEIFRDIFFSNETGGVNQGNVSSKFVENIEIKLPSIDEQREISKMLRKVLDSEEQAKESAEMVIEQIDIMKKSILAKAFRGELGTNNPDEDSSLELMKQIIEL